MKKIACLLLCLLLCLPLIAGAEESVLYAEAEPHRVRYSFDLPDYAFVYFQFDSRTDGGNFVLYSADGHFEGECTLPGAAQETRVGLNVSTLTGRSLAQIRLAVPGDAEPQTPAANLPAAETTARLREAEFTANEKSVHYRFRAPGRDSLVLKCRSPQEWHHVTLYAGDDYLYEGDIAMPATYADDTVTVTVLTVGSSNLLYEGNLLMPYEAPAFPTALDSRVLQGVTVCVDPGHQRTTQVETVQAGPGFRTAKTTQIGMAKGCVTKRMESQVTLEIGLQLRNRLMEMGAAVVTTREMQDTFVGMLERSDIPNSAQADFVLRLHCNSRSEDPSTQGIHVYGPLSSSYAKAVADEDEYRALGETLLDSMRDITGMRKGACFLNDSYVGNNWSMMPSFLVEMGYMTNMEEDLLLSNPEYQRRLVEGMAKGIVQMARMRGLIQ